MLNYKFQDRVYNWVTHCFGLEKATGETERIHRFTEEALELAQACGCTRDDAYRLVDYVFGRPAGDKAQEVGGVMLTLASLCAVHGLDCDRCGENELQRGWDNIHLIREKQAAKPVLVRPSAYENVQSESVASKSMPLNKTLIPEPLKVSWFKGIQYDTVVWRVHYITKGAWRISEYVVRGKYLIECGSTGATGDYMERSSLVDGHDYFFKTKADAELFYISKQFASKDGESEPTDSEPKEYTMPSPINPAWFNSATNGTRVWRVYYISYTKVYGVQEYTVHNGQVVVSDRDRIGKVLPRDVIDSDFFFETLEDATRFQITHNSKLVMG